MQAIRIGRPVNMLQQKRERLSCRKRLDGILAPPLEKAQRLQWRGDIAAQAVLSIPRSSIDHCSVTDMDERLEKWAESYRAKVEDLYGNEF